MPITRAEPRTQATHPIPEPPADEPITGAGVCTRCSYYEKRGAAFRFAAYETGGNSYRDHFGAADLCRVHAPHERRARRRAYDLRVADRDGWHLRHAVAQQNTANRAILVRLRSSLGLGDTADEIAIWNALEGAIVLTKGPASDPPADGFTITAAGDSAVVADFLARVNQ